MNERRSSTRRRVLKAGTIMLDWAGTIDCIVRNLSPVGANLEVESPVGIPDCFTLSIRADKFSRVCHIIWRKARRIGVRFD